MDEYEVVKILEVVARIKKDSRKLVALVTEVEDDVMERHHLRTAQELQATVDALEERLIVGSSGYVDKAWVRRVGQKLTRLAKWHEQAAGVVRKREKRGVRKAKAPRITDGSDIL